MQGAKKVDKKKRVKEKPAPRGGRAGKQPNSHSFDLRLKAVKLYVEEGYSTDLIVEQLKISDATLYRWAKRYKERGEEGLRAPYRKKRAGETPEAVKSKITGIKKANPEYGKKRISQILRRIFFMKASPGTVQKTLADEGMASPPPKKKPKSNAPKPRFFERSRPNQLWQTDIFTFRLGGRNAYLIGYVDDYSRYIVGMELFRSQTAEHVIEVYRQAIAEYGVPREMLTDNGRQYTNWRGTSRFEKELKKDRIHHIKFAVAGWLGELNGF